MGYHRNPKTCNEKMQWHALLFEAKSYKIRYRRCRSAKLLVDTWDDINRSDSKFLGKSRSWKHKRKKNQWE